MDISQKRNIPQYLYNFIKALKYDTNPILLLGTAGLESQQYYGDFDLFTEVSKESVDKIYNKIMKIVHKMNTFNDAYFIELKIQTSKSKIKFHTIEEINKVDFEKSYNDLDFIKLDYIIRVNNKFFELSIIYSFNEMFDDDEKFFKSISDDIVEQKKEGNYFKSLKRIFSIYNNKRIKDKLENTKRYIYISKFLNSEYGKLYMDTSNLKAIKLLLEKYDDNDIQKKILLNLKDLNVEPDLKKIDGIITKNERKYNNKAKIILSKLNNM